jgi:F0F1-type ATP synthase alpha subunit
VNQVQEFQNELLVRLRGGEGGVLEAIRSSQALSPETEEKLKKIVEAVASIFA